MFPLTIAPAPPATDPLADPSLPTASTSTLVTPAGTLNSCSLPVYLNVFVSARALPAPSKPSPQQQASTTPASHARIPIRLRDMRISLLVWFFVYGDTPAAAGRACSPMAPRATVW